MLVLQDCWIRRDTALSYAALLHVTGQINDLLNAASLLAWDARVMMPAPGAAARAHQIATLTVAARDALCGDATARALEGALREVDCTADTPEAAIVAQTQAAVAYHSRIPADLVQRRTALTVTAHEIWADASHANDFRIFQPALAEIVDLSREWADAAGYAEHPYDALLDMYEPGNTVASLTPLYAHLKDAIAPLARQVHGAAVPRHDFLHRDYPPAQQMQLAAGFAQTIGYDMGRGRLNLALHPFEISFGRDDVRLTTRVDRHDLAQGLFTTLHEAGHGIYEQGIDGAFGRTPLTTDLILLYAVGGVSFGAHESQARLWENQVGRSRQFWQHHFAALHDAFPEQLRDADADSFWRAVNRSAPGPVRTAADELTYDLHTMFRFEIEKQLIEGSLPVAEVRDAWNDAVQIHLGVAVPGDAQGVLQDVHWCTAQIGTFCNYTVGNVMAAQLFETAQAQSDVADGLNRADYAPLRGWLTDNVLRHGRRYDRETLLTWATGRGLDPAPYIEHLTSRFGAVYDLN